MQRHSSADNSSRNSHLSAEVALHLKQHTFFHGSESAEDMAKIFRGGFTREFTDSDGRWFRDGNLGIGIYLSCDWRTAVWFGNVVAQCTLERGTRVLDTSAPPDRAVLRYLRREFGTELLDSAKPFQALPHNKRLTLEEFTAIFRHHYHQTWSKVAQDERAYRWSERRVRHSKAVQQCARMLGRYKLHGYGHPADDNGMVIIQPERIKPERVIAEVPVEQHWAFLDEMKLTRVRLETFGGSFPVVSKELLPYAGSLGRSERRKQ